MKRSDDVSLIIPAMVKLLGVMADITKSRTADAGKYSYTYADLGDVLGAVRPQAAAHGLALTQEAFTDEEGRTATRTHVLHESGQWLEYDPLRLPSGNDAQSHGSSITYGRRYTAMSALGLATEDDDGAKAKEAPRRQGAPNRPDRSREVFAEITQLTDEVKSDLKAWSAGKSMTLKALADEPEWLDEVSAKVNELRTAV